MCIKLRIILNPLILIILTVLYLNLLDQCFSSLACDGTLLNANVRNGTECCDDESGGSVFFLGQCHDCKETMFEGEEGGRGGWTCIYTNMHAHIHAGF